MRGSAPGQPRRLVAESWRRSAALDPDAVPGMLDVPDDLLRAYRAEHPLSLAWPVVERLLVRYATDAGLVVALGDRAGRLLWVDGDRTARRRAENMAFLEGADWSEAVAGTSAPGTALALGRAVQIRRDEHFARMVHPWSCSAVPLRDRATGTLLGVLDVTGGDAAVAAGVLPLLEATAAAAEAELALASPGDRPTSLPPPTALASVGHGQAPLPDAPHAPGHRPHDAELGVAVPHAEPAGAPSRPVVVASRSQGPASARPALCVLGRDDAALRTPDGTTTLSARHAEILTVLADRPAGLSAAELAEAVYGRDDAVVTLRAEMVRLRKILEDAAPDLVPLARPYRLPAPLDLDAHRVLAFLERGAHRVALAAYPGPVLPSSTAPSVVVLRDLVRERLREALVTDGSVEALLEFARTPDGTDDVDVWRTALRLLPARSPRRAGVVLHLERLEAELVAD
ncbi:helix-turn-helix domain-containing protein [Sanguibacter sp. HDW7]|uniref:helix-turn-helix domain-containing protein n=1 Tax=Sanguibacter sp. HDW7 TaxID=2714931 RepID=UPI001409F088|nr:helix-turn-helix domain-containing protein [Sanguibacter sp. HDW7]QIK82544.1 GAF domain-containing protein [Sanguibacter sp. HDW7]